MALPPEEAEPGRAAGQNWWPEGEAGQALEHRQYVIPVLGAGVGVISGAELAAWIADHFPRQGGGQSPTPWDLLAVVDEIDYDQVPVEELRERVAAEIASRPANPTAFTRSIVKVPSKLVFTLNYDQLLEESLREEGYSDNDFAVLTQKELTQVRDLVGDPEGKPTIVHLHGSIHRPETLVLDTTSYVDVGRDAALPELVLLLMHLKTLCFIGTRLDETYLLAEMQKRKNRRPHVMLVHEAERDQFFGPNVRARISPRFGLHLVTFEAFAQLDGFAASLATVSRVSVPPEPEIQRFEPPEEWTYVPNVLVERGASDEETEREELLAALGWRGERVFGERLGAPALDERAVAVGHRDVIVGAPGSGKSELLRQAGELVPEDEQPVLVRCAAVSIDAGGEPITLLTRWAASGEGLRGELAVNPEALQVERFHFFFDGLDEIALDRQEDAAALIAEVARAFPQHRFTIASRPVETVAVFPRDEWRILDLRPGAEWQQRYLDEIGVSLDAMEEEMPALRDLRELLQLPFFLARVVRFHREGRLRDFPDLWALIQELVTEALARESARLPLETERARRWLKDIALAMLLAGRTTLSLDELARFELAPELAGSVEEISNEMVLRLMLQARGGGFAFIHRIIGESLAAEALADVGPAQFLLDAVVPVRDDDFAGTRSDWLVPLAFLLPRDDGWRQAVRERDRLQAARGVSLDAAVEERRAAAELLWACYAEWRIWMWDYDAPDLIEDAEVLGRLLRGGSLDDLIEEIRTSIYENPSEQVQGNAIRVLSLANTELEDDLRRVLEDDDRAAVVRRQAAIAARDLKLDALLPLIVARAVEPADSAEAQDCSLCAMTLAPADAVLETALQLVSNSHSRMVAMTYAQRRLPPEDLVRFYRSYATQDNDPISSDRQRFARAVREAFNE